MATGPARAILGLMLDSGSHVLDRARVRDCMHHGIFSCGPDAPLADVAAIMVTRGVHAVAICGRDGTPDGIVSDLDIVGAVCRAGSDKLSAKDAAATEAVSAAGHCSLREAALLLSERGAAHLLVIDEASGHPVGVLSTTDILSVYASFTTAERTGEMIAAARQAQGDAPR